MLNSGSVIDISQGSSRLPCSNLMIGTVVGSHQLGAQQLVARRYSDRGYVSKDLSSQTEGVLTVCSALLGQTTVGTIGVRFETDGKLNADAVFGAELKELRASGRSLCEFTRLALDQEVSDNKLVLARLFHLAYLHAYRLARCELLVIEVNPRHVAFYRRMLGFRVCSEERLNARVMAPAVLLSLDLQYACEQIGSYGGCPANASMTRSLYPYFYGAEEEGALLNGLVQ